MSENKFIKKLKGEDTVASVLEIKNQNTPTSFDNMPHGTSDPNVKYSDHRGNAAIVAKGTENWKLNNTTLIEAQTVNGDGQDVTGEYPVSGSGLWVNAKYTFDAPQRFVQDTKYVLKLCGYGLVSSERDTISFTLIIKFGNSNVFTKVFRTTESSFDFCKEFIFDFGEANTTAIKVEAGDTMTVQLLCGDGNASATIYNGMTVFTALQRRIDGDVVSSDTTSFDELEYDLSSHIADTNNPHQTNVSNLSDTTITNPVVGEVLRYNGSGWENAITSMAFNWVGTQAEYISQNIATLHPEWLCFITDDAYDPQSTYVFEQGIAATTWDIVHNLNKYPSVTVVDSAGTVIDCTVEYPSFNECIVKLNYPFKGYAYLN